MAYGQLSIFASSLQQPFNDWTERHVAQGFAWRPGSVSFRSMVESGQHSVEIGIVEHVGDLDPEAVRAVEVPFDVPTDGFVEVGSVAETVPVSLPAGPYLLRCEFLHPAGADGERVRLTFGSKDLRHFVVVRADAELSADGELLTTALPAG